MTTLPLRANKYKRSKIELFFGQASFAPPKGTECVKAALFKSLYSIKDFGFRDQITRAGMSIPSNIAEGYERLSNKERSNFLNYAKGSAGELRTQIYIGMDVGYIDQDQGKQWIEETRELSSMLHGLIKSIRSRDN